MDERGFLTNTSYDIVTGGLTQRIDDVNTSTLACPAGWTTPAGGGLHLITDITVDNEGRPTQVLGPSHSIDIAGTATTIRRANWTVYQDATEQTWTGQGYATGTSPNYTYTLINPVEITITDTSGKPLQTLQATRSSTSGALQPTDSFPQSSYVRWTTLQYSDGFHLSSRRVYKSIPATGSGSSGTNYDETDLGYDAIFRQNRNVTPGGTITRTVFDTRSNPSAPGLAPTTRGRPTATRLAAAAPTT